MSHRVTVSKRTVTGHEHICLHIGAGKSMILRVDHFFGHGLDNPGFSSPARLWTGSACTEHCLWPRWSTRKCVTSGFGRDGTLTRKEMYDCSSGEPGQGTYTFCLRLVISSNCNPLFCRYDGSSPILSHPPSCSSLQTCPLSCLLRRTPFSLHDTTPSHLNYPAQESEKRSHFLLVTGECMVLVDPTRCRAFLEHPR
jgi:hypothetical protein